MALFDLSNALQAANFADKCKRLAASGAIVELKEKKPPRTENQSRYLHAVLGYFGLMVGEKTDEVKRVYFKCAANRELFVKRKHDALLGYERGYLLSINDLSTDEMSLAIERFRDWAASTAGIYIPSPTENALILQMEVEVSRAKQYL